jgi:hypothetical protein
MGAVNQDDNSAPTEQSNEAAMDHSIAPGRTPFIPKGQPMTNLDDARCIPRTGRRRVISRISLLSLAILACGDGATAASVGGSSATDVEVRSAANAAIEPAAVSGWQLVTKSKVCSSNCNITVSCPLGKRVTGGGYDYLHSDGGGYWQASRSGPNLDDGRTWTVAIVWAELGSPPAKTHRAYAICVKVV